MCLILLVFGVYFGLHDLIPTPNLRYPLNRSVNFIMLHQVKISAMPDPNYHSDV